MAKDYLRMCRKCGTTWLLPKVLAKERLPSSMEMFSRGMMTTGSSLTPFSTARTSDQLKLSSAREQRVRVAANSQCPECGSSKFDQAPVGSMREKILKTDARKRSEKAIRRGDAENLLSPEASERERLARISELERLRADGAITDEVFTQRLRELLDDG